jgi:N-acetylmuramoyl-L-alanine amidase
MSVSRFASEKQVLAATLYAEARGEPDDGQIWVVWVIRNRARMDREYWCGRNIKDVCLCPGQFECWNNKDNISVTDNQAFEKCIKIIDAVLEKADNNDPTGGCDHYNNPDKEGYPSWTRNCERVRKIGNHQFYKSL